MNWSIIANSIVGLISILIAIKPPGLVLTLTAFSWAIIASTCLIPFLIGLYWKGATKTGVIFSMVGGFCTSLIWMILKQPYKIHGFIPGVLASLILMIIVSLVTKDKKELIVQ
jgi:Na+/pantothenate symporter